MPRWKERGDPEPGLCISLRWVFRVRSVFVFYFYHTRVGAPFSYACAHHDRRDFGIRRAFGDCWEGRKRVRGESVKEFST